MDSQLATQQDMTTDSDRYTSAFTTFDHLRRQLQEKILGQAELVDSLLEPADKLSSHLIILRQASLLLTDTDRQWVYYRLALKPSYLEILYETILTLPDPDQVYKTDLTRFYERTRLRDLGGRCRVGILTDNLKDKKN